MSRLSQAFDFLSRRRTVYLQTFNNPVGEEVLADLAKFCRATESTFHKDPRVAAELDGRREVFLRIQRHLQLSDEQLWALHAPATPTPSKRSDDDE